jgi:hypothetical protein
VLHPALFDALYAIIHAIKAAVHSSRVFLKRQAEG